MRSVRAALALSAACLALAAPAQARSNGGVPAGGGVVPGTVVAPPAQPTSPTATLPVPPAPGQAATLTGLVARAPQGVPVAVRRLIAAANALQALPYRYGGGHASFKDSAYDCSGTVSYALHGARLVTAPLDSTELASWGAPGPGRWITVYANKAHAYLVVAGLRLDTSGTGGAGPRWRPALRSAAGFVARHPAGL
jgi:cell wall-associated NlpC family hydrolase